MVRNGGGACLLVVRSFLCKKRIPVECFVKMG